MPGKKFIFNVNSVGEILKNQKFANKNAVTTKAELLIPVGIKPQKQTRPCIVCKPSLFLNII